MSDENAKIPEVRWIQDTHLEQISVKTISVDVPFVLLSQLW